MNIPLPPYGAPPLSPLAPPVVSIMGEGRILLQLKTDGTVVANLDDCDEAAKAFVYSLRKYWRSPILARPSDDPDDRLRLIATSISEGFYSATLDQVTPRQQAMLLMIASNVASALGV